MAWWKKRQSSEAGNEPTGVDDVAERHTPRQVQPAPIPAPRGGDVELDMDDIVASDDPHDRWDIIKRDLMQLDPDFFNGLDQLAASADVDDKPSELTDERLTQSLRRLAVRYLVDESGALLAMWERHVLQIRREGPGGEILVLRARAYSTVPVEWEDRAYRAANEWNRTRRFLKAYVGEPTESGHLPLYGETQIPVRPGLSDALLDEFIDCAAAVSGAFIDWLYDEGGML